MMTSAALVCALALVAAAPQAAPPFTPAKTLAVAGRTNANVSLATSGQLVAVVWAASVPAGTTDIYAAVSRDGGSTFGAAVRVNATPGDAHVNGEQPPRIAIRNRTTAPPDIVVVWTSKNKLGGTIVSARSTDGGKTFGATTAIPTGEGPGNRGWENITVDRAGRVHVVWLDHRELAKSASVTHMAEHHVEPADSKKDAVETAQLSKLYTAILDEQGSATPSPAASAIAARRPSPQAPRMTCMWRGAMCTHKTSATWRSPNRTTADGRFRRRLA
jgi:hypothetical protein